MRVAIIGGGIAGLAAAYELDVARRAGADIRYELFEAGERLGGVIASSVVDGTVIERGPDSFLTEKPAALELCRELGLESQFVASDDARRRTYIVVRNRLVEMPDGLMFLVPTKLLPTLTTPLFSWWTKLRMAFELLRMQGPRHEDESVATLVERHYGRQVVDRLADPLLSGIYGGDAAQLSAQAVLPRLVDMEAKYGSLTRGMLVEMASRPRVDAEDGEVVPAKPATFTTLRGGLQQLVDAVVRRLDAGALHTNSKVGMLTRFIDGWSIAGTGAEASATFDAVIVATPAWAAADLVCGVDAELGKALDEIPYSSSITVNLIFDGIDLDPLPPGFGFLVPRTEGRAMLACTFIDRKFPGRTAPGKTVLRVFVGGVRNAALMDESDDVIAEIVLRELFEILAISAVPELVEIQRWPRAMAQYSLGHKERQERIKSRLAALPGLELVGNAYDGIGISDCIRLGRGAARRVLGVNIDNVKKL
jgi:protoporphyrinogen/coproporphyrinogen III oxidase